MNRMSLLTALTATAALTVAAPALAFQPANHSVSGAYVISGVAQPSAKPYSTAAGGTENGEQTLPGSAGQTVWFKWTPNGSGAAYADVCGAAGGTHLTQVFRLPQGKPLAAANLQKATLEAGNPIEGSPCQARFRATAGTTYYIQLDRTSNAVDEHEVKVRQDTSAPTAPVLADFGPVAAAILRPSFTVGDDTVATTCAVFLVPPAVCKSGDALGPIPAGPSLVAVRAYDAMGNESPVALREYTVDASAPKTTVASSAATVAHDQAPKMTFAVADDRPGSTSRCRIDGGDWSPCASPFQAPVLPAGAHTFEVRSTDAVGNAEATPAKATWTVLEAPKVEKPPVVTAACTLSLKAPKTVSRKALKRGLRKGVRLTVKTTGGCTAKVALKRRGKRVTVVATAGSLKRTATVKVR